MNVGDVNIPRLIDKYPGDGLRVGGFAEAGNGTEGLKE